jgi:hypothetical protein
VSWTLFELAQHADIQSQLRAELRASPLPAAAAGNAPLDADTLAALDKLPLLDAVVRESLRVHAPVQDAGRVATADTAIPLVRLFVDRAGALQHEIRVRKGDLVTLPIGAVHRDEGMWGADEHEWKCVVCGARGARGGNADGRCAGRRAGSTARRRRAKPSRTSGATCSRSSAARTRASASGSRCSSACRLVLRVPRADADAPRRTKILLHALVAGLRFALGVPVAEVGKRAGVVTRPVFANARAEGIQLPLLVARADD